ncbi:MAG TPA: SDR family NAD(P)-dependent oxidoreductase [Flavobacteriales bacterium]|nr:SDR family NAD(P)-dependent oxidoreductase [Flavobacteriales bacterium]HNU57837.1 SDR family NAD(P)-dependent oxidoreductase [Flavobacteriales bacterium]
MKLTGNTILITGGTSGIGQALAHQFHQRGNTVLIAGRRQQELDRITAAHPGMHGIAVDLTDPAAITAFATRVRTDFPQLNVLMNNAGIMVEEDLSAGISAFAVAQRTIQTNITSVLQLTAELMPTLLAQDSATILATTSGLAFVPRANFPAYCGSKAFLHSWLQSLRQQLRGTQVQVLELAPPYVQTELTGAHQATDPNAMPLADYIAEVMQLLAVPEPPRGEVLVERVKVLRDAERKGEYEKVFGFLNQD